MRREGMSLIVVTILIAVLLAISLGTLTFITKRTQITINSKNSIIALQNAKSGVELALEKLKNNEVYNT